MTLIHHNEVPGNYAHCIRRDCPLATNCLRAMAWEALPKEIISVSVLNPARTKTTTDCPFYRNAASVTYARGFTKMQQQMFPEQYFRFSNRLIASFGRNPYFERRRGERPLSPKEQQTVRAALKYAGVSPDLEFDAYEERLSWND
ncbi:MAG: DUF6078 family protein [Bacteroides sp.]|uniref:DUF6078 family protein n=1 Tax=Bacteroides sp. TaxID=29523 RepID=UPI0026DF168C|nr:DUF6078 family protein [Bacteroides sp.]MDO5418833.1 DUF6078 family protein [Bacteroides sp.]